MKKPRVKKPVPVEKVENGKMCPNCEEKRSYPDPCWNTQWDYFPHENPFDCIRFLKKDLGGQIQDLKYDVKDLREREERKS